MKTKIAYLFAFFLIAFCANAQDVQESKYYTMSKREINTFFYLKDRILPEAKMSNENRGVVLTYDFNEDFFQRVSAIFKEVFTDPAPDPEFYARINFHFTFDENSHIIYYFIQFPTKRLSEFTAMEEKLFRFAQLIEEMLDIRPYLNIALPINRGMFPIGLYAIARYLKDPEYAKEFAERNR